MVDGEPCLWSDVIRCNKVRLGRIKFVLVFTIALLSLFTCDAVSAQDQPSQEEETLRNNGED